MEITIGLFWLIILLFVVSTILEHLFNWGYREIFIEASKSSDIGRAAFYYICIHLIKWIALIVILYKFLN